MTNAFVLTNGKESPAKAVLNQNFFKSASKVKNQQNSKVSNEVSLVNNFNNDYLSVQQARNVPNLTVLETTKTSHSSYISPKTSEVQKRENVISLNSLIESYRFAIEIGDKVLLYDKDPRLRMNLGNEFRLLNKFGCLRNEMSNEREI